MVSLVSFYVVCFVIVLQHLLIPSSMAAMTSLERPVYFNMNVYSRPNGKGMVQHIRHTIKSVGNDDDDDNNNNSTVPCFNLQSRHIGSVDSNDPLIKLTFYRSKDCLGASIHSMKPTCTHSTTKLMMKAKSVSIRRLKLVLVE